MEKKIGIPLEGFDAAVRRAACEGMVLLKNEGEMLPVTEKDCIAVFGRCQIDYYRSGTGSGGAVNVAYTTNLIDGFREHKNIRMNEELLQVYQAWIGEHPFDNGGGVWAGEPWFQQEMPVTDELVKGARFTSNKAIVVIGRTAGEDQDNAAVGGSYLLTEDEKNLLEVVTKYFEETAVVLNVSNIIDMSWMKTVTLPERIKAVLYTWQGGIASGTASADVLCGAVTPSGKLPDTIAKSISDYPSSENFGDKKANIYAEDIYVGYRYFETFAPDAVLYPFGFGLSYTTFSLEATDMKITGQNAEASVGITVTVKNSGKYYAGKEVVQVYVEAPQGKLGKPARVLAGFAKTGLLKPGESEKAEIRISAASLASYDDSGITGHKSCYVLEEGSYCFYVGTDARSAAALPEKLTIETDLVTEELEQALAPTEVYTRIRPGKRDEKGIYQLEREAVPTQDISLKDRITQRLPKALNITGDKGIRLSDVKEQRNSPEEFVAQFSEQELAAIVRGEGMCNPMVTPGTASAFGGTASDLYHYGIPALCCSDGPSGIRMDSGLKATQMPIGTLLAAAWDPKMTEELYVWEGLELQRNEIDTLLGPGMNIHRNPLNGRNFEYFSEDPLLTGVQAAAAVRGIAKNGSQATIKHFACNNQEVERSNADSIVSERAVREIYLKGFEIAVKAGAKSVMTSYNPLNGHWAASNYDLCTTILREEWGFDGIVMTDWWAKMNDPVTAGAADMKNTAAMVRAQNDLYMVVTNGGSQENAYEDNTLEALTTGNLTVGELQRCAVNICRFACQSLAAQRPWKPLQELMSEKDSFVFDPIKFDFTQAESFAVHLEHDGRYKFIIKVSSRLSTQAQSASNLMLNDKAVATIQTNGTDGKWVIVKLENIDLAAGDYQLRLESVKAGIEIAWISITR
ncbi:MAG: glycoside hydrolase family 3 C-terminal domain-containing protein [Lachnospiraceae bacterium]|nr:glycoside hydrolase family 3 C-terminal domain-containing protein [Lachnospiraceae bacterium]